TSQLQQSSTYAYSLSSSAYTNWPITCTVEVSGINPTGTITWSSNSSTGSFSPSVCSLWAGICSTSSTYTDSSPGTVTITASYSGDADNTPSSDTMILNVRPEP